MTRNTCISYFHLLDLAARNDGLNRSSPIFANLLLGGFSCPLKEQCRVAELDLRFKSAPVANGLFNFSQNSFALGDIDKWTARFRACT
jgi:hypothetical protein